MYVCLCRGITEKQIRQAAEQQSCSMKELSSVMGVGMDCGTCLEYAAQLLQDYDGQGCVKQPCNSTIA
ncbi:glycoprotein [Picosynechococcus sp. PCC 7003]|uniref:(2Fe-2S)-binding protein n=1 Tax=Picosynechococcus sp. PCC 7003 TaxID=374981 RepID=UPI000810D06B|nr:(2Fe-2S)-binding protein [Picosynechococcus sp. PCC 7003]ANV85286.1 glycoprotein [Picosynechococcus sp. PCC 7003]